MDDMQIECKSLFFELKHLRCVATFVVFSVKVATKGISRSVGLGIHHLSGILHIKNSRSVSSQLALCIFCLLCSNALGTDVSQSEENDSRDVFASDTTSRIQALIETNELDDAIALASETIEGIERKSSRYDVTLVQPLTLLGDGYSKSGDHTGALDAYDPRAPHFAIESWFAHHHSG